jgi:hypothetical protein
MGFSPATMAILEKVYWILGSFFLGMGIYLTWKQSKQVEAVLLTVIGFAALFYYWVKWFKVQAKSLGSWPPYISPCPDYLTLVSPQTTGSTSAVCMDFVGVGKQPNVFKRTDPNQIPQASDADFGSHVFTLDKQGADQAPDAYNAVICAQVQSKGLSWIGVCE